jgi:hypothetical protein
LVSIHVRVQTTQYDDLSQRAHGARLSVPEYLRRQVAARPDDEDDDD